MSEKIELDLDAIEAAAKAATPQDFDSAQVASAEDGWIECPGCGGEGSVELTADYLNYDGQALGVQFYGIGDPHVQAEAHYRAARPAVVLAMVEEIRSLRQKLQQPLVPEGFALVPQSMLLSKEVIGVINFHCGDTDQEEGGQFGQYTDGRLWVGYVLDDDGSKVHGLHIATDEYPEEGSTTLIEFPGPDAQQESNECGACGGCNNGCQLDKDSPAVQP
ncbi:hypothetical protein [Pseudomonas qingdaonensis]|uniref:hypothetical protein n=1 Tax=Pseudomonas qingdaonensis TaxID=2056231 RepID=UPI0036A1204A